ncbi:precorrin-2 C(20)-methyltransferase [Sporolituus thermophilus]|uniref:Precorrin-2 C20-methyltransferase /cobalt-factor II C20-methyltransferase n=1 Tax=Sporolituus thermophilus DSM 23256 TaxID=1123285 RepID=A0A1G7I594_9FIRM|nr:precorrin-2 C(20)-methyltransferase [Sporolituus thermophilus]SDF07907.1 precorrin-2 C20-methyltransferase /cobalt-factor II C20-methyltransferase [Sporolituus thermophilus DSM 23256]
MNIRPSSTEVHRPAAAAKQLGKLFGIGVGPGAPDLLTLRAIEILKSIDVVCIPRSKADNDSLALTVAGKYIPATAEIMEVATPMTRDRQVLEAEWQRGAEKIAAKLTEGLNVAFITIGDAMLFSTYTYLLKKVCRLLPGIEVESVPGITSFAAAAAHLNTALAEGNEKLAIIPAVDDPGQLREVLRLFPNAVLMKVAGQYNEIVDVLTDMGLKDKAVYISRLGYPDQFVTDNLDSMRQEKRDYLSLILVKQGGL